MELPGEDLIAPIPSFLRFVNKTGDSSTHVQRNRADGLQAMEDHPMQIKLMRKLRD